jgi:glycosyltransferase involved in cell wall biosynthesis
MSSVKPAIAMILVDIRAVGGAQLQVLRIAAILRRQGHEIILIGQGRKREIRNHLHRFKIDSDFEILPVPRSPGKGLGRLISLFPNIYFLIPCLYQLFRYRHHYEIVHGQLLMGTGLVCALATLFLGKPSIVKLGSAGRFGDVMRVCNGTARGIRKRLFGHISKFACLTREIESELVDELGVPAKKLVRVPNGIDLNEYHPVTAEQVSINKQALGFDASEKLVLFVGRLELKKRVDFLLKAWEIVQSDASISARLLIVGDGGLRSGLEQLKRQLGIQETVDFYGVSENIAQLMQTADLFVLPSVSEGLANVFLEAMASALPIVATRTSGNAELLKDRVNARFFSRDDYPDLAEQMRYLLTEDQIARDIGRRARKTVEAHFDIQNIAGRYAGIYQDLAGAQMIGPRSSGNAV